MRRKEGAETRNKSGDVEGIIKEYEGREMIGIGRRHVAHPYRLGNSKRVRYVAASIDRYSKRITEK